MGRGLQGPKSDSMAERAPTWRWHAWWAALWALIFGKLAQLVFGNTAIWVLLVALCLGGILGELFARQVATWIKSRLRRGKSVPLVAHDKWVWTDTVIPSVSPPSRPKWRRVPWRR